MTYSYRHARPALTVDVALFTARKDELCVLLVQRKNDPFKGSFALPGGFVEENEPLERAALRELREETNVSDIHIEQLGAFGDPGRDPRGHTVSIVYVGFVMAAPMVRAGDDAASAVWQPVSSLLLESKSNGTIKKTPAAKNGGKNSSAKNAVAPRRSRKALLPLAFDHGPIVRRARHHLEELLLHFRGTRLDVVPEHFTLSELQHVYEAVLGRPFNAKSFRARLLALDLVESVTDEQEARVQAKRLYRWRAQR